ncbi:MAG: polymer-forming cytoskeletal protein [Anaerovorax sp.]
MAKENNFIKAMKELTGANLVEEAREEIIKDTEQNMDIRILQTEKKEAETQKKLFKVNAEKTFTGSVQDNSTIISKTMVIVGDVKSADNLEVLGMIKGPVETSKELTLRGKVLGDVRGQNITMKNCAVQGNVMAENHLSIDGDSVILGDVSATDMTSSGKVKGAIIVKDLAKLEGMALVNGDITAERIIMEQGVKLNGKVTILSEERENDQLFEIKFD